MEHHEPGFSAPPRRILVVDDDAAFRSQVVATLRASGYEVCEADGARSAMRCVLAQPLDVVVLDLTLGDGHGIDVARAFQAMTTTRDLCVVALTAHPGSLELVDPRSFGAASILIKPLRTDELLDAVADCFSDEEWTGEFEIPAPRLSS